MATGALLPKRPVSASRACASPAGGTLFSTFLRLEAGSTGGQEKRRQRLTAPCEGAIPGTCSSHQMPVRNTPRSTPRCTCPACQVFLAHWLVLLDPDYIQICGLNQEEQIARVLSVYNDIKGPGSQSSGSKFQRPSARAGWGLGSTLGESQVCASPAGCTLQRATKGR